MASRGGRTTGKRNAAASRASRPKAVPVGRAAAASGARSKSGRVARSAEGARLAGARAARPAAEAWDPAVFPPPLRQLLAKQYGEDEATAIEEGCAAPRSVTLRANTLKTTPEAVGAALDAAGIRWRPVPWSREALIIEDAREQAIRDLPLYEAGEVYLQSLSSMIPPLVLAPQAGESVLDMAAAPGGKTTQMAALSGNRAQITACERSMPRAERLKFNLQRQGAGRVSVLVQDARRLDPFFSFDKVLLDAPCSGSGTVARGPDGWRTGFSEELLRNCIRTQEGLLRKAIELVRPGGELVYSTCSILAQENEGMLARMLPKTGMRVVPLDAAAFEGASLLPCGMEGALCIRPSELYEGFFVAKLRKGL